MSNGRAATMKRGHCKKHDEHSSKCLPCMWLREDERRVEAERIKKRLERTRIVIDEAIDIISRVDAVFAQDLLKKLKAVR